MKRTMNIDVHHLTRVEGHGNIHIAVRDGKLVQAQWSVVETPRFFEAMLKGMSHDLAPLLTARICGICSIGHCLASLRAIENAMAIKIPPAAGKLRLLAVAGIALRLKKLGNDICDAVAGRTTHPVSLVVGGVSKAPDASRLESMKKDIQDRLPDIVAALEFFSTLAVPDFERETEFVSLKGTRSYPWIGGSLVSSDGVSKPEHDYLAMTNEYTVDFSTSKFAKLSRESFAVGALARINNNFAFLHEKAKSAAGDFGLKPVNCNPFMNSIAQLIECYHVMLESIELIDSILDGGRTNIRARYETAAGRGVGAVEVPRGILYHDLETDKHGVIVKANCIIPTTQNNANIHYDLGALVTQLVEQKKTDEEITLLGEMLVRAYDPCISCSVH
jgi:sulfhydrogenase subunit alpha